MLDKMKVIAALLIIYILNGCNNRNQNNLSAIASDSSIKVLLIIGDTIDNDSIFSEFLDCVDDSLPVKIIRRSSDGRETFDPDHTKRQADVFTGYTTDPKKIVQLIDSFPVLWEKPGVKYTLLCDCVIEDILFICADDTVIKCSFYPGMTQLFINREVYTIDIDKLDRALEPIRL